LGVQTEISFLNEKDNVHVENFCNVMPDLIRHPAKIGNTGFRVKPGMTLIAISNVNLTFIENRVD